MKISVIITSLNEGEEVAATIKSIRENTEDFEIVLVDDASTDGSCIGVQCDQLIRHEERVGIVPSRLEGVRVAKGECFAFLDAHQRVSEGCLNKLADLAMEKQAITWPCVTGIGQSRWMGHGASMRQKDGRKNGLFEAQWRRSPPVESVSRCSTLVVPGYVIPRKVWPKVQLIPGMSIHGASEAALAVKAFFTDVDLLHLCGPVARHKFNSKVPFELRWRTQARNHALVARVCFDDKTWHEYWAIRFRRHIKEEGLKEMENEPVLTWHREFQKIKCRPDEEFWTGLIGQPKK